MHLLFEYGCSASESTDKYSINIHESYVRLFLRPRSALELLLLLIFFDLWCRKSCLYQ